MLYFWLMNYFQLPWLISTKTLKHSCVSTLGCVLMLWRSEYWPLKCTGSVKAGGPLSMLWPSGLLRTTIMKVKGQFNAGGVIGLRYAYPLEPRQSVLISQMLRYWENCASLWESNENVLEYKLREINIFHEANLNYRKFIGFFWLRFSVNYPNKMF